MATILDKIIAEKREEVLCLKTSKEIIPVTPSKRRSFIERLQNADSIAIIAEYKRASPSKGLINNGVEPAVQARLYEKFGASAISVLTDQSFFKGSFQDLEAIRAAVDLPILCKDFIIDHVQIDYAAAHGANIILLIVAALEQEKLEELYRYATSLGLEVLVEVHNLEELERALKLGAKLIGINNRNLKTFEVSLETTEKLASLVRDSGAFLISESGIHHVEDVKRVRKAGANGILVGEALMKSDDIKQSFLNFRLPLVTEEKA